MEELNVNVLVDAKEEYTRQLVNILMPRVYKGFLALYRNAKNKALDPESGNSQILVTFQEMIIDIPKWNQEIIDKETQFIIDSSKCDWIDDLITAVFLSHTKILTAVRTRNINHKLKLNIPKVSHFIHKVYIESGREFYKNPYLFDDRIDSSIEMQRNLRECEQIIRESV